MQVCAPNLIQICINFVMFEYFFLPSTHFVFPVRGTNRFTGNWGLLPDNRYTFHFLLLQASPLGELVKKEVACNGGFAGSPVRL